MNELKNKRPGLKCPECDFLIEISIPQLLSQDDFRCPGCGLILSLERASSRESLEALSQIQVAIENLELTKGKYSK